MLTMLNENSLHSSSKSINTLASESSRLGQVGVNMGGKVVARGKTHCVACTLAHLQLFDRGEYLTRVNI